MLIEAFIYYFWLPNGTMGTTLFYEYKKPEFSLGL